MKAQQTERDVRECYRYDRVNSTTKGLVNNAAERGSYDQTWPADEGNGHSLNRYESLRPNKNTRRPLKVEITQRIGKILSWNDAPVTMS